MDVIWGIRNGVWELVSRDWKVTRRTVGAIHAIGCVVNNWCVVCGLGQVECRMIGYGRGLCGRLSHCEVVRMMSTNVVKR